MNVLKDWCRDCKNRDWGNFCFKCLYPHYREQYTNQPPRYRRRVDQHVEVSE